THLTSSTAPCLSLLPQLQDTATIPQNSMLPEPSPQPLLNVVPQTTTRNFENDLPKIVDSIDTSKNPLSHETHIPETLEIP
ncbi:unnamed protein product, partial [Ilex paraguariensis]